MTADRLIQRASSEPMADGGDTPMSAAEEVLAWLLIEKIGVPDDVPYSPDQAQEIIARHLDRVKELDQIAGMLAECQGDDSGSAILPEFEKGASVYAKVEACLHLLERRRDALTAAPAGAAESAELREALTWYEEQVRDCRKLTPEGNNARSMLDRDGGAKARIALAIDT